MPTSQSLAFDIYGTLVDTHAITAPVAAMLGLDAPLAERFSELWREKQYEYTFRRASMGLYEPLPVCSRQAMVYTARTLRVDLSEAQQEALLKEYRKLPAFPEVADALNTLQEQPHMLVAFSNGPESSLRPLLKHNNLQDQFDLIVSVDERKTFKPDPAAYAYLLVKLGTPPARTWVVSSNPFDVIGAKHAGLRAAWIKRGEEKIFDPWGIEPDFIAPDLAAFADWINL